MKPYKLLICLFSISLLFAGCSASDFYQGEWKSTDLEGNQYQIVLNADTMTVRNDSIILAEVGFKQYSVSIENGARKYGITLKDGRSFTLAFPNGKEPKKGAIIDENGRVVYTIGQDDYYRYNDVFGIGN